MDNANCHKETKVERRGESQRKRRETLLIIIKKNCNHKPAGKPGYLFTLRMRHNLVGKRSADRDQTNPSMPRLSTVLTKNRHQPMFTGGAPKGGVGGYGSGERIQTLVILGLMDDLARRFFGA